MNKTVVFVVFTILIVLALIETLIILLFSPEHFTTFSGFIVVLIGLASGFAATVWSMKQQKDEIQNVKQETSEKLDVVQRQTNGTLTRLIEQGDAKTLIIHHKDSEIAKRDAEIAELRIMAGLPPKVAPKGNHDD